MKRTVTACGFATLLLCTPPICTAQSSKPLATQYVDCMHDARGNDTASRTIRTPLFRSKDTSKAYGEVVANYTHAGCKNTTTIYIATAGGPFHAVLQQAPQPLPDTTIFDGNGLEALRWSPSGNRLLAVISQWKWGTDAAMEFKYALISTTEQQTRELPVEEAVAKLYPQDCLRQVRSEGWIDDQHLRITVLPSKAFNEEGQPDPTPSCVQQPTTFNFDIESATLRPSTR